MNKTVLDRIKYLIALFLYGTIGLFIRYVEMPSEAIALYRGVLGALSLFVFIKLRGISVDREAIKENLKWLIISGICLGLNWVFLFAAYTKTTVAIGSLCNYMAPITVVMISPIVLHEKLDIRKIPLILISFAGVIMISGVLDSAFGMSAGSTGSGEGNVSYDHPLGILLGLLAALCFVGILICNKHFTEIPAIDKAFFQLAVCALTIIPCVLVMDGGVPLPSDIKTTGLLFIVGIVYTGFAYIFYFTGVGALPIQTVAILGYLEPVISILCSLIFLSEPMSILGWIGAVMIIGSAVVSELLPSGKNENN